MPDLRPLTLVLPYYENPGMLAEQQRTWQAYPEPIKARLHVIVVDDGSPTRPAAPVVVSTGLASFRLFRTGVDVRWNWIFCRNLGVHHATTDWVLLTDIDHVVPGETLMSVMQDADLDPRVAYRFSRVDAPHRTPYKPHPNSWLLTRTLFHAIGGYDERFSGFYGTDAEFRERVDAKASGVVMRPEVLIRYPRDVIADASTTTYGRKEEQDRINLRRIRAERGERKDWRPLRLSFPWEQLV